MGRGPVHGRYPVPWKYRLSLMNPLRLSLPRMKIVTSAVFAVMAVVLSSLSITVEGRVTNLPRQRMDWATRLDSLSSHEFKRRYRLSKGAFAVLSRKLEPILARKPRGQNPISTDLRLSMALRYLSPAGGSYRDVDICDIHGVSYQFYPCLCETCEAICEVESLHLPLGEHEHAVNAELQGLSDGYMKRSWGTISGAVGALDGIAIRIRKPSLEDDLRPISSPGGAVNRAFFGTGTCSGGSASSGARAGNS